MSGKLLTGAGRNKDNTALPPPTGTHPYLEDQDTSGAVEGPFVAPHLAPRIMFINSNTGIATNEQLTKFNVVGAIGAAIGKIATAQALNPQIIGIRQFNPRNWEGSTNCQTPFSLPFNSTGPTTTAGQGSAGSVCDVYAGHWMYAPGTTTTALINSTTTTIPVTQLSVFTTGAYSCIHNSLGNSTAAWANSEHVLVTGKSAASGAGNLTVTRAHKSVGVSHASGSYIAQHELGLGFLGTGASAILWAWNTSTQCPLDGAGKQIWQVLAEWLSTNYNRGSSGTIPGGLNISGVRFDTDHHYYFNSTPVDMNNDGIADSGVSGAGVNWWGQGLELFYERIRQLLPAPFLIITGESSSRGFPWMSGAELEGWPISDAGGSGTPPYGPGSYPKVDQLLNSMAFRKIHRAPGTLPGTFGFSRVFSNRYQFGETPVNADNASFRFGFGLSLLEDSWYGQDNSEAWAQEVSELWWDEYAVITTAGPTFGNAVPVNASNEAAVRAAKGWMGLPLGFRRRIYDEAAFTPAQSVLGDGGFELTTAGWNPANTNMVRDTTTGAEGSASSLRSDGHTVFNGNENGCRLRTPLVQLTAGQDMTLCFSAKASVIREIGITIGFSNPLQRQYIDTAWRRYVVTSRISVTQQQQINFELGRENTVVWLDEVYLFAGNASIWRRDFERAVVIVNATGVSQVVNLGGTFQRIQGTGQDAINNGATVTQVTVGHHDTAFLVRPL